MASSNQILYLFNFELSFLFNAIIYIDFQKFKVFYIFFNIFILISNSWTDFAKLGWKTIVVGMVILMSTYVGSAVVAHIVLKIQGII
ncbi:hypothetical protein BU035_10440 [Staphylococcus simulans]|nr:hypothetical protein BU035_10440 [Staphylococcus simulans]